jgi:4-carboxymuconolactone decarboxylase
MTPETHALGGRLPLQDPATMGPGQRRFYDVAMAEQHPWSVEAGFQFVTDDERLIGPFNAFLRRPDVSARFGEFSRSAVQSSSVSPKLREVVVLAVGSVWGADYELYAHRILAEGVGISADDAGALASGRCPAGLGDEEELAFELVRALVGTHRVEPALYADALAAFGELGLFDIWALTAVYLGVSSVLNLFAVPAPGPTVASDETRHPSLGESIQQTPGDDAVPTTYHRDHGTTA